MPEEETPDTGTEEQPTSEEQPPEQPDTGDETDWKAEAEKYKALARKHEGRAKTNATAAKELEQFKTDQLSEQEKAVKAARDEGYTEGRSKGDQRLIRAEVIAAAAGKAADPTDVFALLTANGALADIQVGEDGEVDTKAIVEKVDALLEEKKHLVASSASPTRDPDFGARTPAAPALTSDAAMDAFIRDAAGRR